MASFPIACFCMIYHDSLLYKNYFDYLILYKRFRFTIEVKSYSPGFSSTPPGFYKRKCACHKQQSTPSQRMPGCHLPGCVSMPCSSHYQACDGLSPFDCLTCQSTWTLDAVVAPIGYCRPAASCEHWLVLQLRIERCQSSLLDWKICSGDLNNQCLSCYPPKPNLTSTKY